MNVVARRANRKSNYGQCVNILLFLSITLWCRTHGGEIYESPKGDLVFGGNKIKIKVEDHDDGQEFLLSTTFECTHETQGCEQVFFCVENKGTSEGGGI